MFRRITARFASAGKKIIPKAELLSQLKTAPNDVALHLLKEAQERLYLQDGSLYAGDFSGAQWQNGRMASGNYERIILINADLRGIYLGKANLRHANLQGANLQDANLREANFRGANLEDANLTGAHLASADLRGAILKGANLTDANLWGVQMDTTTILPDGSFWQPTEN